MDVTHEEAKRFLEGLWYRWADALLKRAGKLYSLNTEQQTALESVLLKPNDWILDVKPALNP